MADLDLRIALGRERRELGHRRRRRERCACVEVVLEAMRSSGGAVLLELATGRVANDSSKDAAECCLVEWAWRRYKAGGPLHDVVDESIQDRAVYAEDAVAVFVLGVMCTGDDAPSRPSMKQVLQQLARYDRTASVAGACRDGRDVEVGQVPKGKQGRHQAAKRSYDVGAFLGGDEESGNFVARPV